MSSWWNASIPAAPHLQARRLRSLACYIHTFSLRINFNVKSLVIQQTKKQNFYGNDNSATTNRAPNIFVWT